MVTFHSTTSFRTRASEEHAPNFRERNPLERKANHLTSVSKVGSETNESEAASHLRKYQSSYCLIWSSHEQNVHRSINICERYASISMRPEPLRGNTDDHDSAVIRVSIRGSEHTRA